MPGGHRADVISCQLSCPVATGQMWSAISGQLTAWTTVNCGIKKGCEIEESKKPEKSCFFKGCFGVVKKGGFLIYLILIG